MKNVSGYEVVIKIDNSKKLTVLKTEFIDLKTKRFEISIDKDVKIKAEDAVALKSALMSVTKALEVYEKMEGI